MLGPSLYSELVHVGVAGLPFSWDDEGRVTFDPAFPKAKMETVLRAFRDHDPRKPDPAAAAVTSQREALLARFAKLDPDLRAALVALLAYLDTQRPSR